MTICFFERPSWCAAPSHGLHVCESVPRWGLPEWPVAVTKSVELLCLVLFTAEMGIKWK